MCRLLGYVSKDPVTFSDLLGNPLNDFVAMSHEHKDGWGVASCDFASDHVALIKDLTLAAESPRFTDVSTQHLATGALLHLRLASDGIEVDISNNHPFTLDTYSFMHNGTIKDFDRIESEISSKYLDKFVSTTDSERYFYRVLTEIDAKGLVEGYLDAVRKISATMDFTSINSMLLTPEYFIAVCEFNEGDNSEWTVDSHYELRFIHETNTIKVASTGWGKDHWERLPNHSALVINRKDLSFEVLSI